jgi:hormone-sensitive lipase
VHGGGYESYRYRFVALSSRTHQSYTRRWAKASGAPVFSVDYRKAPENPNPDGLDDSWQTYNWLLNESHEFFRIRKRKRIILVGDSAGGNLIIGITNLCLLTGTPVPEVLVVYYPCKD